MSKSSLPVRIGSALCLAAHAIVEWHADRLAARIEANRLRLIELDDEHQEKYEEAGRRYRSSVIRMQADYRRAEVLVNHDTYSAEQEEEEALQFLDSIR